MNTLAFRQCVIASICFASFYSTTTHASQNLIANGGDGSGLNVGTVNVTNNGGTLNVEIATSPPFLILEAHAAAAATCDDLPQTARGNPKPGHFEGSDQRDLPGSDGVNLTLDNPYGNEGTVCIAAHAVVFDETGGATLEEAVENTVAGAWAEGESFAGSNWATHFQFALDAAGSCNTDASCIVFVTRDTFSGDLIDEASSLGLGPFATGLAAGDAICNHVAGDGGAGLGGSFTAWLSDSTTNAIDRVTHSAKPYKLTDGVTTVADDFADLLDCGNDYCLQHSIVRDEDGLLTSASSIFVWTGTGTDGNLDASGNTCLDWSSSTSLDTGRTGWGVSPVYVWTSYTNTACSDYQRLYCFQD